MRTTFRKPFTWKRSEVVHVPDLEADDDLVVADGRDRDRLHHDVAKVFRVAILGLLARCRDDASPSNAGRRRG